MQSSDSYESDHDHDPPRRPSLSTSTSVGTGTSPLLNNPSLRRPRMAQRATWSPVPRRSKASTWGKARTWTKKSSQHRLTSVVPPRPLSPPASPPNGSPIRRASVASLAASLPHTRHSIEHARARMASLPPLNKKRRCWLFCMIFTPQLLVVMGVSIVLVWMHFVSQSKDAKDRMQTMALSVMGSLMNVAQDIAFVSNGLEQLCKHGTLWPPEAFHTHPNASSSTLDCLAGQHMQLQEFAAAFAVLRPALRAILHVYSSAGEFRSTSVYTNDPQERCLSREHLEQQVTSLVKGVPLQYQLVGMFTSQLELLSSPANNHDRCEPTAALWVVSWLSPNDAVAVLVDVQALLMYSFSFASRESEFALLRGDGTIVFSATRSHVGLGYPHLYPEVWEEIGSVGASPEFPLYIHQDRSSEGLLTAAYMCPVTLLLLPPFTTNASVWHATQVPWEEAVHSAITEDDWVQHLQNTLLVESVKTDDHQVLLERLGLLVQRDCSLYWTLVFRTETIENNTLNKILLAVASLFLLCLLLSCLLTRAKGKSETRLQHNIRLSIKLAEQGLSNVHLVVAPIQATQALIWSLKGKSDDVIQRSLAAMHRPLHSHQHQHASVSSPTPPPSLSIPVPRPSAEERTKEARIIRRLSRVQSLSDLRPAQCTRFQSRPTLQMILDDERAVQVFTKFLIQDMCAENVLFYNDVRIFRRATLQAANLIHDLYIRQGADFQVNIPGRLREAIECILESRKEDPLLGASGHMFDAAAEEVLRLMESNSLARFLRSDLFHKFLEFATKRQNSQPKSTSTSTSTGTQSTPRRVAKSVFAMSRLPIVGARVESMSGRLSWRRLRRVQPRASKQQTSPTESQITEEA